MNRGQFGGARSARPIRHLLAEQHPDARAGMVLAAGSGVTLTESDGSLVLASSGGAGTPWDFDEGTATASYGTGTLDLDEGDSS